MKSVFLDIEAVEFKFFLFEDEIDDKMKKKLRKLGLPDIAVSFPENSDDIFEQIEPGLFKEGDFYCSSFSITDVTEESRFSAIYNDEDNSITISLKGLFFSINDLEVEGFSEDQSLYEGQNFGFISAIKLRNEKGKYIKKPKDKYGMSIPLEALVQRGNYGGPSYKIMFKVVVKKEIFRGMD